MIHRNLRPLALTLGATLAAAPLLAAPAVPATAPANQPTDKPDLVIVSVGVLESENQVGMDAHLTARIENRGAGATIKDVAHGVAFYVDGEFVAWSDTYRQDLKPGQFAILRSSGGPRNTATWKIAPGKHTIRAVVDDIGRIDESDEANNVMQTTLEWKTPMAMNSEQRSEFEDVSPPVHKRLRNLAYTGLFEAANMGPLADERMKNLSSSVTRYEVAVAILRLGEDLPDLKGADKACRLQIIKDAKVKYQLSPAQLEAADDDWVALQTEFAGEMARLEMRQTGIEARDAKVSLPRAG